MTPINGSIAPKVFGISIEMFLAITTHSEQMNKNRIMTEKIVNDALKIFLHLVEFLGAGYTDSIMNNDLFVSKISIFFNFYE